MTVLLSVVTVLAWGLWIPIAQAVPGVAQRVRALYAGVGNLVTATAALVLGGGALGLGWKEFWLPVAGGLVWVAGNYAAFRATELLGLARAAGLWTPLNIVVSFVWGTLLFDELAGFGAGRYVRLGAALVLVFGGVAFIVTAQGAAAGRSVAEAGIGRVGEAAGFGFAGAAGVLWGSYFVPAQWAGVPAQVGNFPLALGIMLGTGLLTLRDRPPVRLSVATSGVQLGAGVLFGVGNLALLSLVSRVGTGTGFTIAQLSLLVNASVGILYFKVPTPKSRQARLAVAGILLVGTGGALLGSMN